ncbi:MAG: TetR/AcrR family transcriptional regulator [Burkholderiales bacterium]|nr:TetR/AcrR family transcriptional regulator [Burkholderiales bacterium]
MPRRTYTKLRRAALEEETRERIVRATVALHARHGGLGTSYAMIAKQAGVSPQTVYNHFPDLAALFGACTGHVEDGAPPLGPETLRRGRTPAARLRLLAAAAYARHEHLAPWMRLGWYEAALIPELGAIAARGEAALRQLIAAAVAPEREPTDAFVDAAFVLLDYPAWKALTRDRPTAEAARIAADSLSDLLPRLTRARSRKAKP